ncbi:MAG: hypothetical protein AAF975_03095 [Spirochaetota bacterium]
MKRALPAYRSDYTKKQTHISAEQAKLLILPAEIPRMCSPQKMIRMIGPFILSLLFISGFATLPQPLRADDLRWAEEGLDPRKQAPEGLRNNFSLEMLNAIEGLFQPRFQRYFRDSLSYYLQLQLGSERASGLNFFKETQEAQYNRLQLGFEVGLTSLLYARNSKITKDTRRWGSGIILELGLRIMFSNISGAITDNILAAGLTSSVGGQLQVRNFSICLYLQFRSLIQFSTQGQVTADFPIIVDRGALSRSLPSIPMVNSSQIGTINRHAFYTLSQTLNLRINYYF